MNSRAKPVWLEPCIMPIQIRPNLVIQVQDIPHDLTKAEAEKIVRVIEAMVKIDD